MADFEKVKNGVTCCGVKNNCCGCEYFKAQRGCINDLLRDVLEVLKEQPKKGEWIERESSNGDPYYDCSACGEPWVLNDGTPKENGMNYCPHCGADMRKDGEHE